MSCWGSGTSRGGMPARRQELCDLSSCISLAARAAPAGAWCCVIRCQLQQHTEYDEHIGHASRHRKHQPGVGFTPCAGCVSVERERVQTFEAHLSAILGRGACVHTEHCSCIAKTVCAAARDASAA